MSHGVSWVPPLTRLPPWFPGQFGVPGTDNRVGLRQTCEGAIFYVDPNYPGVSDQRDGTNPDDPLATVGAALSKCQPYRGDTIAVMQNNAWHYGNPLDGRNVAISEEVIVTVPGVRIVGIAPSGAIGVVWTPASDGGLCIHVQTMDVLIEGFIFTDGAFNGCDAILAEWGMGMYGDNLVVRNCVFDDDVDVGIQLEFSWYCQIYNNAFLGCKVAGIYTDPLGMSSRYNAIHDNLFQDCGAAVFGAVMGESCLFRNSVYNANAAAALLATDEGIVLGAANNQVFDNWLSCAVPGVGPAAGDYDDFCTGGVADAWINNHCMDGDAVTNPT